MEQRFSEKGETILRDSVFARVVTECGARYSNRMIFSTPNGRPVRAGRTGKELLSYIGVEQIDAMQAVNYKIYVIVRFGVSMTSLLEHVANAIRKETKYITGYDVNRINFFVTGVKSKNLVKRDLEFIY